MSSGFLFQVSLTFVWPQIEVAEIVKYCMASLPRFSEHVKQYCCVS